MINTDTGKDVPPLMSDDQFKLADDLTEGARDDLERAGLSILLSLAGWYDRADVVQALYTPGHHNGQRCMGVDWRKLGRLAEDRTLMMSDGERAALLLAASIAGRHRVAIGDVLPWLDDQRAAMLIVAVHTMVGRRYADPAAALELAASRFVGGRVM